MRKEDQNYNAMTKNISIPVVQNYVKFKSNVSYGLMAGRSFKELEGLD